MSITNSKIPIIAITPDEEYNIDNVVPNNIEEVATDVENIYFQVEKRKKKSKKHVQKKDLYATDVEDLAGSDDDFSSPIIKHTSPFPIDKVLEFDIPTTEENFKVNDPSTRNKPKLRTQASVSSSTNTLQLDETETNHILTDLEDFDGSDEEDEVSEKESSDTDLLKEIIHDSGTIAISDTVKKFLQAAPSPMVTPIDVLSDDEYFTPKSNKKMNKQLGPMLIASNFNNLTDTEILQSDSNDEAKPKHKYGKGRRHTLPKKINLDVTDTEDLDVSENEQIKSRRVTVAEIPKVNFDETDNSFIAIPQNYTGGDSDCEEIPMFKHSKKFLQVIDNKNDSITDAEDMDGDSEFENDVINKNEADDSTYEFETGNDVINEKCSMKTKNTYRVEGTYTQKKDDKNWNSTENETDEEEDQCDSVEKYRYNCKAENVGMKFVQRNKNQVNKNKSSLFVPSSENEVLTDVENLNSSDDDCNEIPVTVINDSRNLTDTESVEGEIDNKDFVDIDLPSCSRKLIREKVNENNVSQIVSTNLNDSDDDPDTINLSNKTDVEEMSGDDFEEFNTDKYYAIEIDIDDGNSTEYKDSLKLPTKQKIEEGDTDVEDISNVKPRPKKLSKRNLAVCQDDGGKYTDVEDLLLSDTENLQIVDNSSTGKTDVEDFDASDNDNDKTVRGYSRTPDLMRQMGRQTVCSQEGSGQFSVQDRKKLDDKHNIVNIVTVSPSPTNTDDEFITSADDENYSRAETATPIQTRQDLDDASSSKVHTQNIKKIDLDAEDEVMYLKGGGFQPDVHTDTEEMGVSEEEYFLANDKNPVMDNKVNDDKEISISAEFVNEEWSSAKATPSDSKLSQEPVAAKDAAPQDSGAECTDYPTGIQRTLEASCSKLEPSSTPKPRISSYTHLDKILDYMLAEVDEQEKLVQLDSSPNLLKPVCINSLRLVPSTDALIEIPVSHFAKSPKVFETKHEIILGDDSSNEFLDLDDEISLSTLNKSQDTESLFSFESISETYFLEGNASKYKASSESLNDLETKDDEHIYEIVEPRDNNITLNKQESNDNEQDIWWEGTYRDLSIVPEEDEDNISDKNPIDFKLLIPKPLNDDIYDNISHHSSSDVSQTTGDEYDTSDLEHNVSVGKPVKAEIKLLVKTLDRGKEDIEIRSVREIVDQVKNENSDKTNKFARSISNKEKSEKHKSKPSFTLQRLFVRGPESTEFLISKELSKSNPELVATTNIQFPLQYDPNMSNPDYFKNIESPSNVDLYANTPFYPCYGSYIKSENVKLSSNPENFPTAYCDWLLQPDDPNGGITTSPSKQLASSEVTGESIIHDVLSKDLKPVLDQTKMFIRMESQPEISNVCVDEAKLPSLKVMSPDSSDKASKELDNRKEKSKSSRGFFSSLKSLVSRSVDSSDSESREEKTPKKKKKEKGTPKKSKKSAKKDEKQTTPKHENKSPKLEKKTKALYESQELDNIPAIDEIETNGLQVTDLDAEPSNTDDVKVKAKTLVDNVINDSQKAASKLLEGKIQEFNFEGTVTPEEIRRSTEPIIINEDEFLVVIEPNNYNQRPGDEYEDVNPDIKEKEVKKLVEKSDDEEKSDTLKRKSVGFLKLFGKKDSSKESDDESKTDDEKHDQKLDEHRKSSGFFGLFSKKPKEEEPIIEEKETNKEESKGNTIEFSKEVQQQMVDSADFLLNEVEFFEDVRLVYEKNEPEIKEEIKLTNAAQEKKNSIILNVSEEVQQQIVDTARFLRTEVEFFEDVRPPKEVKQVHFVETKVPPVEQGHIILSDEIQQQLVDTASFLLTEIENFEDVKRNYKDEDKEISMANVENFPLGSTQTDKKENIISKVTITEGNIIIREAPAEIKAPEEDQKEGDENTDSKPGFFSKLGEKFGSKSIDKKDEPKEKKPKKKKEKKPGFFSKIGEKLSSLSDDEREVKQSVKSAKEDVKDSTEKKVFKIENKIKNVTQSVEQEADAAAEDTQKIIVHMKDDAKDIKEDVLKAKEQVGIEMEDKQEEIFIVTKSEQIKLEDTVKATDSLLIEMKQNAEDKVYYAEESTTELFKDTTVKTKDQMKGKMQDAHEIEQKTKEAGDKIERAAIDAKDNIIAAKDSSDKTKQVAEDTKDATKETGGFFSGLSKMIKGTAKETKEKAEDINTETKTVMKDSTEKADTILSDVEVKIKDKTHDAKQSAEIAKDSLEKRVTDAKESAEKVEQTVSDAKDVAEDAAEKTGGFFSGLGKKIKGTAKDTKEVVSDTKSSQKKIDDFAADTKEALTDSSLKTGAYLSDVEHEVEKSTKHAADSVKLTLSDVKSTVKDSADIVEGKLKVRFADTKESVAEAADTVKDKTSAIKNGASDTIDKIKELADDTKSNIKDSSKDAAEKTEGFFSGLGKKFKGTAKETKEEVILKAESGKEKIADIATETKVVIKDSAKKTGVFFSNAEDSVEESAAAVKDAATKIDDKLKESVKDAGQKIAANKDSASQKIEDTTTDIKIFAVDTSEKATEKVKESASDAKDTAKDAVEKTGGFFSSLGRKIKGTAKDTKEEVVSKTTSGKEKVEEITAETEKVMKDSADKTETFFSDMENKMKDKADNAQETAKDFKETIIESKDTVKDTASDTKEAAKEAVEKTGGFFSGLGKKIKGTAKDTKEEVISKTASGQEKIEEAATDTKGKLKDSADKLEDKIKTKADDAKDSAKDVEKSIKESITNVEDTVKDAAEKVEDRIVEKVGDAKQASQKVGADVKDVASKAVQKAGTTISMTSDKIREIAKDTEENAITAKDTVTDKIKEAVSDTKDAAKDVADKTGGFFSGLGKKIKGTAKDTKEEIVSKATSGQEKVKDVVEDTKEVLEDSADRTGAFFSSLGDKLKDKADDVEESTKKIEASVTDTKDSVKKTASDVKDAAKDSAEKTGGFFSSLGRKIKGTTKETKEEVVSKAASGREKVVEIIADTKKDLKESTDNTEVKMKDKTDDAKKSAKDIKISVEESVIDAKDFVKETASDVEDAAKDTAEKTGGFFSGLEKKIEGTTKDTKEEIVYKTVSGQEKVKKAAADTKEVLEESAEKTGAFFSNKGDKIKDEADDAKESAKDVKESVIDAKESIRETASDVKDAAKDTAEKTGGFFSGLGKKIKGTAKDTKEDLVCKTVSGRKKGEEVATDTKEVLKKSADKTGTFFSGLGGKIEDKADDARESARDVKISVKESVNVAKDSVKETASDVENAAKDTTKKTEEFLSGLGKKIEGTVKDAKEEMVSKTVSGQEKVEKAAANTKEVLKESADRTGVFFSGIGDKIKDKAVDAKESAKDVKISVKESVTDSKDSGKETVSDIKDAAKDTAEKTGGFFSGLGKKIKGTAEDTEEKIVSKTASGQEKIEEAAADTKEVLTESTNKTGAFFSGIGDKIKDKADDAKESVRDVEISVKESVNVAKDSVKETASDVKDAAKDTAKKTGGFFSGLGKKIEGTAKDTKVEIVSKSVSGQKKVEGVAADPKEVLKESTDETGAFFSGIGDKIKNKADEAKESAKDVKESVTDVEDSVEDTASDVKETAKDTVKKTGGFFSGLEKKIEGTTKDTKEEIISKTVSGQEKVEKAAADTKEVLKESAEKTGAFFSGMGDKIKDKADDAKESAKDVKESVIDAKDSVRETASDVKDAAKDTAKKTEGFFSGLGKKIKGTAKDTKEEIVSKSVSGQEKVEEAAADTKEVLKKSADKTGAFFSGMGDKIKDKTDDAKESAKDVKVYVKESVIDAKDSIKETASDVKGAAKDSAEKTGGFFSGLGKKIKGTAKDTKEEIVSTTVLGQEKLEEIAVDTKEVAKDSTDKAGAFFSGIGDKMKDKSEDAEESVKDVKYIVIDSTKKVGDKVVDTVDDAKENIAANSKSASQKATDTAKDLKDSASEAAKKADTALSSAGDKIIEIANDSEKNIISAKETTVDKIKEAASGTKDAAKDATEKTGGFFSGLGKKIKGTAKDTKEEIVSKATSGEEKIKEVAADTKEVLKESADKTGMFLSDTEDKIKDKTKKSAKDVEDTVEETASDVKDAAKDAAEKTGGFLSGLGKKIKGAAKETKEEAVCKATSEKEKMKQVAEDTKEVLKDSADKTETFVNEMGDKIKDKADSAKESAKSVTDTVIDAKDDVKDSAVKAEDKIKEKVKDAKDDLATASAKASQKIEDTASDTKDAAKNTIEKTDEFFSDLGRKMKDTAEDTKEEIVSTAIAGQEKVKKVSRTFTSEILDKSDDAKESVKDVQHSIKDSVQKTGGKMKVSFNDTKEDIKETTKEAAEKTGGFFSGLGKKFKGTVKESKEEVVSKAKAGQEEIKEAAIDTKEDLKDSTKKTVIFVSDVQDKMKDKVSDAKDSAKDTLEKSVEKVGDTLEEFPKDAKEKLMSTSEKVEDTMTGMKSVATDVSEKAAKATKDTTDKIQKITKDTKNDVITIKDTVKVQAASDTKDAVEKTEGFFSGLGKKIKGTTKDTKEVVVSKTTSGKEKVKEVAADTKEVLKESADKTGVFLSGMKEKIEDTADETTKDVKVSIEDTVIHTKDTIKGTVEKSEDKLKEKAENIEVKASQKVEDIKDAVANKVKDTEDTAKDVAEKTGGFFSDLGKKMKGSAKSTKEEVVSKATSGQEKVKEIAEDTKEVFKDTGDKIKDKTDDTKDTVKDSFEKTGDKILDGVEYVREKVVDTEEKIRHKAGDTTSGIKSIVDEDVKKVDTALIKTGDKIGEISKDTKDAATDKVKEAASGTKDAAKDTIEKTEGFFSGLGKKIKGSAKDTKEEVISKTNRGQERVTETAVDTQEVLKDSADKTGKFLSKTEEKIVDEVKDVKENVVSQKTEATVSSTCKKIEEIAEDTKKAASDSKDAAEKAIEKTEGFFSGLGKKIKGTNKDTKQEIGSKAAAVDIEDIKISVEESAKKDKNEEKIKVSVADATDNIKDEFDDSLKALDKKKTDFICYVTTPKMQRKGIGGSQRLSKDDRPALLDVSNMPIDISSDEEEYIVTEPGEQSKNDFDEEILSGSPMLIESIAEDEQATNLSPDDSKKRPLFRIGSKDEESIDWGEKFDEIHSKITRTQSDTAIITPEAQSDIDLIENKLAELGKALDDLEKVDLELEPQDDTEDKIEHKLRRVERRFERMASETMDKDAAKAKDSKLTSPEIEAKREDDYKKMVSQLSQEEVSECQKLYSTLWDDITFTPSEEWDSKTPDSQPDDIQDLPQETSGGPLTKITTEGPTHPTNIDKISEMTEIPKPKPRIDKIPDASTEQVQETTSEVVTEDIAYSDRKKFWESVAERPDIPIKKRMSLYEEEIFKQSSQENIIAKKRTSIQEIGVVPPVPKPRSTLAQLSTEEQEPVSDDKESKKSAEKSETLVSEYKASFKNPTLINEQKDNESNKIVKQEKSESMDSEAEYVKYEHQTYENPGYLSDDQETEPKQSKKQEAIAQVKRRQMSVSQPPVAAARKTIFERSASLPTEDLQDVSESSVRARKQFFEQQLKKEMVIDQLMTQLEEEELQEYKTLTSTEELSKVMSPEEKIKIDSIISSVRESDKNIELKEMEKKISPISSSSSQDTRTEDDITQYTPSSVKDLSKYFQSTLVDEAPLLIKTKLSLEEDEKEDLSRQEITDEESIGTEKIITSRQKQSSTESEQSISSERSIELGSADELQSQVAEILQYRSKPSDSLEVHVDKSEIEDSEKGTDIEQDTTDIEVKSIEAEEYLSDFTETEKVEQKISPIREHKEVISDTVWEVSIQSQLSNEIVESVSEIPIERQVIVEKDEELSGSVRDESDLGSEIHQDHSESYESERVRSESHSEVEQLILESLYHQKIHPEDARKIASELIDDIEAEIERRNLSVQTESDESEPPAPHPEVAKNQISDYLRQLAESKGLDAKEVELVESVLARKQSELSRLGRRDTQTSSMEITDEDLRYSGAECDFSPSDSQENILEEQIEQLELETNVIDLTSRPSIDEEKFHEKLSDSKIEDIHVQQDREINIDDSVVSLKTETSGTVETATSEEKDSLKKTEQIIDDQGTVDKTVEQKKHSKTEKELIDLQTAIDLKSETCTHTEIIDTKASNEEKEEFTEKTFIEKTVSDKSELEKITTEEVDKKIVCLEGTQDALFKTHEEIEGGFSDTTTTEKTKVHGKVDEETENKFEHKQEITVSEDGTETISEEIKENVHSKTVTTSEIVDHKREQKTSVTTFVHEFTDEPATLIFEEFKQSDESKSSPYESAKSPEDKSSSSSVRKDDSDTSYAFDKPEVIFRKTKIYRDLDTSSSSGKLKADRRSGADFEAYSSSGESHYHSFELDSGKSRPCSSDVEGLMAAGSSEYESALTSQDVSSRSHITSTEYHTAVSSLSSRESMKSLDSESSGHMASIEVSEASETLVPSTFELEGDILDGAVSQLLEDEVVDSSNGIVEPYDRDIPEHVIRGDYPYKDKKSSFDTISDSDIHGESMDISEEDSAHDKLLTGEVTSKMKRSQEMTFQPVPKAIIGDSPQSENAIEMDERFGSSLEDGSVLSISLSSQSDATALRTVIEMSRRDSDKLDGSMTISGQDSMSASNMSLDKIQPLLTTATDSATSTGFHAPESLSSVTLTTSAVDENGTQSVCTQVTSQTTSEEVYNGPTQVDYVPEYDDVVETKKVRGHRRQESTFVPSMIPGFTTRSSEVTSTELTLKEEHNEEMKDVDETEDTEADSSLLQQKESEEKPVSELVEPIERPLTPEPSEDFDIRGSHPSTPKHFTDGIEKQEVLYEKQMKMSISEKSSIEEGEAEAAFSMVAHISPAHKAKGIICPIMEDEDAEKHELETRERAQKEMEKRRAQIIRDQSPGSIPDIMVTEHMTPLIDRAFHYPDLELEEQEALAQRSAPPTPASISSKSSEDTDQGKEYEIEDTNTSQVILEEPTLEEFVEEKQITKSDVEEKTREPPSTTDSPNSDSFEMLEKPDIIDDFVVIEEVAKEAAEHDTEGKSVHIQQTKYIRKHDEEVEEYLVKSAPTPLTRMTDLKYYPDGNPSDELGPFDFEDSPPQAGKKSAGTKTADNSSKSFGCEYDKELEASKKWIEMQFQGDQAALISAGYGYEMEFERGPLEDIKEEEATDFESSRIGSLDSQKQSIGSLGSVKDSFSSTPEYDVLAGRKFFTRSGEHDDVSMSSLQEFEHLEHVISLENRRHHQGSQDSSSNGSFSKRYHASRSGQGDDVSMSSLKEFEGLETACIEAHKIEIKAKEEEEALAQIEEAQESLISESESCKSISSTEKKNQPESEEEDYEKRMFEIDEIIKQAQSNVEKFIDMKDVHDKTESMGRGDSLEEVAKVPELELDEPIVKSTVHTVQWDTEDVMQTSTDSLNLDTKPSHHESADSLDMKTGGADLMTASTDSIEYQIQERKGTSMMQSDSIEMLDPDKSCMITSDSLELTPGALAQAAVLSDSIDEDGSRIGVAYDQSSSSGFSIRDENVENLGIRDQHAEFLLGSTDSLDPSSSTATHATYQYETDSVLSGSFTSGGSNTMVSSTDTIDPLCGQAHGVDIAAAVRKVWFDDDSFGTGTHFTTELIEDGSKPFVTEVIEPCEGDPEYSHTIHRKIELPPEIKKITFKGPDADLQLRQYIENFGEGEDVQESQEVDKDGNVHVKRVVQKRFIVKADPSGEEKRISGPELESYLQQVSSQPHDEFDLSYRDPNNFGLTKQTRTDGDGTKTIYGQTFTTKYEAQGEESSVKQLLSSIASDVTENSTYSEYKLTRHVDNQQEQATGTSTATFSGAAAAKVLRAQGCRRKPLRYDISVDDQTEVDPREHDWRFILPQHDEHTPDEKPDSGDLTSQQLRDVADQHQLSTEMKELLEEMEKHAKQ